MNPATLALLAELANVSVFRCANCGEREAMPPTSLMSLPLCEHCSCLPTVVIGIGHDPEGFRALMEHNPDWRIALMEPHERGTMFVLRRRE